ncbi:MAG: MATE family efflux transporter, partial [Pseudomonadota bacterium]
LAQAGSVRVGRAYGRGSVVDIGRAGWATFVISVAFAFVAGVVFFLIPEPLIALFLDDDNVDAAAVIAFGISLLWVAAAFQLVDAGQAVAAGSLRGLKDTRVPMQIAVVSYWAIGVPVAYGLAFFADWGAVGVWTGLASGLFAAAVLLNLRFLRREPLGLVTFTATSRKR